jgi:hypothetical protein
LDGKKSHHEPLPAWEARIAPESAELIDYKDRLRCCHS